MLTGGTFLQQIRLMNRDTALLFERVINGVNNMANHLGVDPQGKVDAPAQHSALTVTPAATGDMVHVSINNQSAVKKNVQNFVEHSNDGGLSWRVDHLGASNEKFIPLPTFKADGTTKQSYIFRSYPQYLGSDAQAKHTYWGSQVKPTPVTLNGTAAMDIPSAVGSGTAAPNGQQGGQGLGTVLNRPAQTTKRPNVNVT